MSLPKVSIITGYYRRAGVVRRTLEALLGQTRGDIEVVVFDDGSGDGTADAIADFAREAKDTRLRPIYHETNLGFVNGLIKWIPSLNGDYVAIQGSGDVSLPRRIELQAGALDSRPEIVLCGCYYTNVVERSGIRRPRTPDAEGITFEQLLRGNLFSHGEVMYRRTAYEKAGGYRRAFRFNQDYDLWLRMIKVGKFTTVKENLYDRYVSFDGVSYDPRKFPLQVRYSILARRLAQMGEAEVQEVLHKLEKNGPMDLVANDHPEVQKRLLKGALRSLIWGAPDEADAVSANLVQPQYKLAYHASRLLLNGPAKPLVRPVVNRAFGISVQ